MKLRKGIRLINKYDPYYIELRYTYSILAEFSVNPSQPDTPTRSDSQFIIRSAKLPQKETNEKLKKYLYTNRNNDDEIIDAAITLEEDEHTVMDKNEITNVRRVTIDAAHTATDRTKTTKTTILQRGKMWVMQSAQRRDVSSIASHVIVNTCNPDSNLQLKHSMTSRRQKC